MKPLPLQSVAVVGPKLSVGDASQQLLDRFLLGYPRDGAWHLPGGQVRLWTEVPSAGAPIDVRVKQHGLVLAPTLAAAVSGADAIIVTAEGAGAEPAERRVHDVLVHASAGARCVVCGALARSETGARELLQMARQRQISLRAGSPVATTFRLPQIEIPHRVPLTDALIVVQGNREEAEFEALEGLLPLLENRRDGETGVKRVRGWNGDAVWQAGVDAQWSMELLAAALSRSNTPQGDPVKDGRTQDLAGLNLVPQLATRPQAWVLEHEDGLRSAILVLNGVVTDINFALRAQSGRIFSAQLYRPPAPAREEFSRFAAALEDFFRGIDRGWREERAVLVAGLLQRMRRQ